VQKLRLVVDSRIGAVSHEVVEATPKVHGDSRKGACMRGGLRCAIVAVAVFMMVIPGFVVAGIPGIKSKSTAIERLATIRQSLQQTHGAKDAAAYLRHAATLRDFLNGSPNSILQLMLAQLFAGEGDEAVQSFGQYVRMGQANEELLRSQQFDALRTQPQYATLYAGMVANGESKSAATKVFELKDAGVLPEDIDYDATTKLFYITSVLQKQILAVDMMGNSHVFAQGPDKWPMMAVKVDEQHHLLWATEVALDGFSWTSSKDWGRSAVLLYDLGTGKLLLRIEGPPRAGLGDMTLTGAGDAIVSDGDCGGVYRVRRETQQIERLDGGDFISPQTPAMLPGGEQVLIPDYVRGIGVLNLRTKHVDWIPMEGRHALSGIDGLYLFGHTMIATQNGTTPERVVQFELDRSLSRVESESILERATPTLGDPTHGVVVDGQFYYIANSGWDTMDEHGKLKEGKTMSGAFLMRVLLNGK
jgi:hypothetical protein